MDEKLTNVEGVETEPQVKFKTWPIALFLILLYLVVAMSDNFKGIFVPMFREEFGVNSTQIGYVMTASLFAYGVFQYIGGLLIEKFGYKKVLSLGFILSIAATLLLANCSSFAMLIASMFLLNVGAAMFNISVNTLGPALPMASTAVLMSVINGSYGGGNTVLQIISGKLLATGIPWRKFFIFMLVVIAVLFIYLLLMKIPLKPVVKEGGGLNVLLKSPMIYLYIAAVGFYLAAEYGIGNWFVNYMNQTFGMSPDQSSLYIALFFGSKTVGLLIGGFIADRIGYFRCILIFGSVATVVSFIGIAMGQSGLIVFALGGFAYSVILPTIISSIGGVFKDRTSMATGVILMCGTLIGMIVSQLIGILNDSVGTHTAFFMIAVSVLCCTVFSQLIGMRTKKIK